MSQKGVKFLKILISKFYGFFWNLFLIFKEFFRIYFIKKIAKRVGFFAQDSRSSCAATRTRGGATRGHMYTRGRLRGAEGL